MNVLIRQGFRNTRVLKGSINFHWDSGCGNQHSVVSGMQDFAHLLQSTHVQRKPMKSLIFDGTVFYRWNKREKKGRKGCLLHYRVTGVQDPLPTFLDWDY